MAATKVYLVVFNQQGAGGATAGYKWENDGGLGTFPTVEAKSAGFDLANANVYKVLAGSAQAACTGVRKAFGEGKVDNKMQVIEIESTAGTAVNTYEEKTA